jgi:D-alanyl-D-alanine-carboxypeptidase/D-alanyl-D-alanine-endopeptidase
MTAWQVPRDSAIRELIAQRLDGEHDGVSLVVGVTDGAGRRVIAHRAASFPDQPTPDADTLFEIGSNTKVFTALLLAEMAARGEVGLDDPVALAGVALPERNGRQITLRHLAAHMSGLPRDADNYAPADRAQPFADFSVARLHDFLGRYRLDRDPGAAHAYSNVGAGLLGHALSQYAGQDFEALVRERLAGPLGLPDTTIALTPEQAGRAAKGHDHQGRPTPWLDLAAIPGAGALRSTATDLLTFLEAALRPADTPLGAAMQAQLADRRPTGRRDEQQALGWLVSHREGVEVAWHVGRTLGGHAFIGFAPQPGVGVVVLGNMGAVRAGDDLGFHLITGAPLASPPARRRAVTLAAEQLDRLAGRYRLPSGVRLTVTRVAGHLSIDIGGRATHAFIPESETRFFLRHFDSQVTFELNAGGEAVALATHQDGRVQRATRLDERA